ncbi:Methyltransferase type 11, partial [Trinorchestia longiramus]
VDKEHFDCIATFYGDGRVTFKPCLNIVRFHTVHSYIKALVFCGVNLVKLVDYGCGDKRFLMRCLLNTPCLTDIVCVDKNLGYLVREKLLWQSANDRRALNLRVRLIEANVLELPDPAGSPDVVTLIEVIEHFCVDELPRLLWGIFGVLKPKIVIITTPNTDFNRSAPLPDGKEFRHPDHKFEWNSKEFQRLCNELTGIYINYVVTFDGCGLSKFSDSFCSQIAIFARDDFSFCKKQVAACEQHVVKTLFDEVLDVRAAQEKLRDESEFQTDASLKRLWYEKKRPKCKVFFPETKNEKAIEWVLKVLKYAEMMPGRSSIKAPVLPSDWSCWDPMAVEQQLPRSWADELDDPPSMKCFLTEKFVTIQDITYQNVFALFFNEMKYRIQSFTWCLNPYNNHYPFVDKILKLNAKWDYLNLVRVNPLECSCYVTFLKLVSPLESPGHMAYSHNAAYYDDDNDGACLPSHRSYMKGCRDCPFLYFTRVKMAKEESTPKTVTIQTWQSHVVYENSSATKLYFSFVLLQKYLCYKKDDKFIR